MALLSHLKRFSRTELRRKPRLSVGRGLPSSRVETIRPRSVQAHPPSGAAIGLPAEPELVLPAFLPAEEPKQACRWQTLDQLLQPALRPPPHAARPAGWFTAHRVVEADVGGTARSTSARPGRWPPPCAARPAARPRRPGRRGRRGRRRGRPARRPGRWPPPCAARPSSRCHGDRGVEADVGGGAVGQRGDRAGGPALRSAASSLGHGDRVVEADVGGGAVGQRGDLAGGPALRSAASSPATATGSSRLTWAAARSASAATGPVAPPCAARPAARPRRPGCRG